MGLGRVPELELFTGGDTTGELPEEFEPELEELFELLELLEDVLEELLELEDDPVLEELLELLEDPVLAGDPVSALLRVSRIPGAVAAVAGTFSGRGGLGRPGVRGTVLPGAWIFTPFLGAATATAPRFRRVFAATSTGAT